MDVVRTQFTALSNTLIGAAAPAGGGFGLASDRFSPAPMWRTFAVIAAFRTVLERGLDEVQQDWPRPRCSDLLAQLGIDQGCEDTGAA